MKDEVKRHRDNITPSCKNASSRLSTSGKKTNKVFRRKKNGEKLLLRSPEHLKRGVFNCGGTIMNHDGILIVNVSLNII